jgi:predicted MPP superfamily phosphohydrolase
MSGDKNSFDPHRVNDLTVEEELPKIARDPNKATILLHHSPVGLQYVTQGNIDVMLSGHTHGGQIWPFTIVAKFQFPLSPGVHKIENTWFLVSQGAGTFGPWMRLGTSNEMQVVRLVPLQL